METAISLFLFLLIVFFIVALFKGKNIFRSPSSLTKKQNPLPVSGFQKKGSVLNSSERQLYLILQSTLGKDFIVLAKVRIEDFIEVKEGNQNWGKKQGLRSRIKSRHTDFLVCDPHTTKPLMAIELDGASH